MRAAFDEKPRQLLQKGNKNSKKKNHESRGSRACTSTRKEKINDFFFFYFITHNSNAQERDGDQKKYPILQGYSRRIIKEHCLLKQVKKCQKLKLINTPSLVLKTSGDDDVPRATAGTRVITVIKVKDKNGHVRLKKLNVKRIRQKTPLPQ
ncbi:hypothetical protein GLOIN_2v1476817 [Rhizophagus irregularis DAOM 181602=DAOM 197198]|uniref:Uncharacterized protein n=1 Tax=Rhizophagus irregularis (strain DAOM 181602 / DAOM 197198 / MUCL 43194) TaxID=747089 RepID=A0A2P4Q7N9_RHIID|nr:hypothetical protein GLOIN_2v1476817 [Rhizophagus irregularis DAOM 181602=DAOM 197198]POG73661.1 hypothetical protein GLOIN_2v1476817 [Rhizophagus irregularis DAOM 181602=DAOM 197198]|eukprot:XP_025180527.1 hypothetical protein GLOIN_2v1476817 [Rhizophagus irregularis DAOM 181602=DAOM 197198]